MSDPTVRPGHYIILGCLRFPGIVENSEGFGCLSSNSHLLSITNCYFTSQPVDLEVSYLAHRMILKSKCNNKCRNLAHTICSVKSSEYYFYLTFHSMYVTFPYLDSQLP